MHRTSWIIRLFLALVVTASLGVIGCGDQQPTGVSFDSLLLVEDPLTGVLNSTLGRTPSDPDERVGRLADALGLDEEQEAAVSEAYAVLRAGFETLKAQVEAGELSRTEAKAQAMTLIEAFESELQIILTSEQWDQLQEMRQNRFGRGRGHRNFAERWEQWLTEIGADEQQIEDVLAALETARTGLMDLFGQVRSGELTRDEAREQAQGIRDALDKALQSILTEEQFEQLQDLRPDCSGRRGHSFPG